MGQKVHPIGFRLGVIRTWDSRWYAKKDYAKFLHEDFKIRNFLKEKLYNAGISKIEIERAANKVKITIHTARPGIVIGKKGAGIEELKRDIHKKTHREAFLSIMEVKHPEMDAQLVAENIAGQLKRRVSFRRAMKKSIASALKHGIGGIKVRVGGRLGGSEIARKEWYAEEQVPLHTLKANIDYGFAISKTTYGTIGVRVWVYKGQVQTLKKQAALEARAMKGV